MAHFFLNLKMERVWKKDYANHFKAINDIADYIVGFYNSITMHSKRGNLSSNAFERKLISKTYLTARNYLTTTHDHGTYLGDTMLIVKAVKTTKRHKAKLAY